MCFNFIYCTKRVSDNQQEEDVSLKQFYTEIFQSLVVGALFQA